jgi:hypothetical protein
MSRDQNAGRSHNIKNENSSFERVEQLKYLGTTLTYQNSIQEEIKSRLVRKCLLSYGAELSSVCYPKVSRLGNTKL